MYSVQRFADFSVVNIDVSVLQGGLVKPDDLGVYIKDFPVVDYQKGVILSGKAPIWLAAALTHHCHPHTWVATFDPRLGGAVVVSRHHPTAPNLGSIVPIA